MQLMEDGSVPGTPTPSCTAQKRGRGLVTHCLPPSPPPPPLLHPTWETGNHTHTSASRVKKRIYSVRTQYSIATKATIISSKTNKSPTSKQPPKLPNPPHPTALILGPLGSNKASVASDPSSTPFLPDKAQRVAPDLWQHLLPWHPTPPVGSGVLRVLPPEGLGQQFDVVLSQAVIWGTHTPKKMGQALACRTGKLPQPHWGWTQP